LGTFQKEWPKRNGLEDCTCEHVHLNIKKQIFRIFRIYEYNTVILPVVLYGCKAWSLTVKKEYRLKVFENSVLRRICGPKSVVTGGWRQLHNEELRDLYFSSNINRMIKSRKMIWAAHVA
jgi:hypothetical protein